MNIKEFSKLCNVSVRTLHYYDQIGLLKPSAVDENNGYRSYDQNCLERMQQILFYRELEFSLSDIHEILSSENFDKKKALSGQKQLLTLKKERIERLISALDSALKGEKITMNVFDNSEFEKTRQQYADEAREKWGETAAYKESEEKTKGYTKEKYSELNDKMTKLICEFSACKNNLNPPDSDTAQALVLKWQNFITENYYTCTKQILQGLGQMYAADPRFKENIDRAGGAGTADFAARAIEIYCR
jgi:DNA-binding transcriptional MerR regulator